jgi:glycosyltransferase involved in cell wall biosynthesis
MKSYDDTLDLHVVYIITKLELGGAQKVCLSLFEGLKQSGYTSRLISGTQGPLAEEVIHNPFVYLIPTLTREISFLGVYNEIKNFFHLIHYLKRLQKKYPRLIVHTHSTKAGLVGRWAALFAGVKRRVHTIHGYAFHPHQSYLAWFIVYSLELFTSFITSHFICVSSTDVQTGIRLFPFFKNKYSIIRAAVDWDKFTAHKVQRKDIQDNFIIGTIACFKKQKNLVDLIKAFHVAYQSNQTLRLEIIGDGILRSDLETLINNLQIQSVVALHGWQKNVVPFMHRWHTFALTSLWEGLPCAIIEARLLKLPIISYNTGGIHDVIINKKNGLLYNQKDWISLAHGILELSTNKELYQSLCTYNENLLDFHSTTMVNNHIALYKELSA